jgi:hypothetical protein
MVVRRIEQFMAGGALKPETTMLLEDMPLTQTLPAERQLQAVHTVIGGDLQINVKKTVKELLVVHI